MAYRRYLDSAGFEQMEGCSFEVEQRFMFLILDDNTRVPMCNDDAAELAMEHWTRALRRHFRRRFTVSEVHTKFYEFKERYNTYTALTSNPASPYAPPIGPRHSYDAGSGVGDVGSWSDYIRRFAVEPHDGTPHASEGDSTARSRPRQARPPRDDVVD
ncbi:hypothetical protein Salat_1691300 [Sesamum alatum]|uniref:Uncharacterized protein n=1 Tax=Sesamum alatum TaxID=300844 RepID=A0AAE1Y7V2_9LAMI|nr:hypothetical protein Salat_1691300 [Sesamum alatum]